MRAKNEEIKTATQRFFDSLDVLNTVLFPPKSDPFIASEAMQSQITSENYLKLLSQLHAALMPLPPSPKERSFQAKLPPKRRSAWRAARLRFDLPDLYEAHADTLTPQSVENLIARVRWTTIQLLRPLREIAREGFNRVTTFADAHFTELGARGIGVRVRWGRHRDLPRKPFLPRIVLDAGGIDTLLWLTLFEFVKETPNYRTLLRVCPQCWKIFIKPRKNAIFCSHACASKAAYKRWVRRGGLKKRKLERFRS
jgi:hypothetical protein